MGYSSVYIVFDIQLCWIIWLVYIYSFTMAWLDGFSMGLLYGLYYMFRSHPIKKLVGWDHVCGWLLLQPCERELSVSYTNVEPDFLSFPFQTGIYYIPGSSRCSLFPPLITEAKIIASNSGKRLWFEKMPLPLLGLPFKSKRHYTSELGSKPEVVISLSRIGESPYFVCRIRQDDSPVYLYYDQNLNHDMNNLKQHLLHVVNII